MASTGSFGLASVCRFDREAQLVIAKQQLQIINLQDAVKRTQLEILRLTRDVTEVYVDLDKMFNFLKGEISNLPADISVSIRNRFNLNVNNRLVVMLQPPP